jgi:hypothetical protein
MPSALATSIREASAGVRGDGQGQASLADTARSGQGQQGCGMIEEMRAATCYLEVSSNETSPR